jgi:hypothetical protein
MYFLALAVAIFGMFYCYKSRPAKKQLTPGQWPDSSLCLRCWLHSLRKLHHSHDLLVNFFGTACCYSERQQRAPLAWCAAQQSTNICHKL